MKLSIEIFILEQMKYKWKRNVNLCPYDTR